MQESKENENDKGETNEVIERLKPRLVLCCVWKIEKYGGTNLNLSEPTCIRGQFKHNI